MQLNLLWWFLCKSLCGNAFVTLGYLPRRGIAGSQGRYVFSHVRNCQTSSQSGCTTNSVWEFRLSCVVSTFSAVVFFILAIHVGSSYHVVALICIYLMINNVEHLLKWLWVIYVSSLMNRLLKSIQVDFFFFWLILRYRSPLHILYMNSLSYDLQIFYLCLWIASVFKCDLYFDLCSLWLWPHYSCSCLLSTVKDCHALTCP